MIILTYAKIIRYMHTVMLDNEEEKRSKAKLIKFIKCRHVRHRKRVVRHTHAEKNFSHV